MTTSFENKKSLRFTITLGVGVFSGSDNRVVLEGFRAIASIQKAGGQMMTSATVRIFGLEQELMAKLTTLAFLALSYTKNQIKIEAIDGDTKSVVYDGQIINAWGDYATAPDVSLYIETQSGFFEQLEVAPPISYKGVVKVSDIIQQIATGLGLGKIENNGVVSLIKNPHYDKTYIDQLRSLCNDTETDFYLDSGILAITPKGIARTQGVKKVPTINSQSGLIGYPTFDKVGVTFKNLFNPDIRFGGQIVMESDIPQANGTWQVCSVNYDLESEKPNGQWFASVRCTGTGLTPL
jgi:hypothetical protein